MKPLRLRWVFSALCALVLFAATSKAQVYSFRSFGLEKGVFPSRIECIEQAESGELLIGTLAGLVIYDGYKFETLGVADGLAESSISALYTYEDDIWLGHWTGNLTRYNLRDNSFEIFEIANQVGFSSIAQMLRLENGELLVLTSDGKLFALAGQTLQRLAIPGLGEREEVSKVLLVDDRLQVITNTRVVNAAIGDQISDWKELTPLPFDGISDVQYFGDGIWLFGTESGLQTIAESTPAWAGVIQERTKGFHIKQVHTSEEGVLWLATENNGVIYFNTIGGTYKHITRNNGLSYNLVQTLFIDRERNVWIGTTAALDQFIGEAFTLNDARTGIGGNLVWDLAFVRNDLCVLTNVGMAICTMDGSWGELRTKKVIPFVESPPRRILSDGVERVYVLDKSGGLWRASAGDFVFEKVQLPGYEVRCMEMVNGVLWIGTDRGVVVLRNDQPSEQYTSETGLTGNRINGIFYSKVKNETWITSIGTRATRYKDGKFQEFGDEQGLTSSVVQDAAFDAEGDIWLATYDKGVFECRGDSFVSISASSEGSVNTTFAIDIDEEGVVWIGHNWGIDAYDSNKGTFITYGDANGFQGIEVNPNALIHHKGTGLWMGTLMGVLSFSPNRMVRSSVSPLLRIDRAYLGAIDLLNTDDPSGIFNESNDLSIEFHGISLRNPGSNQIRYRLLGIHQNWRTTNGSTSIEYLSLPSGSYTFELEACNSDGICSEAPLRIDFRIAPPFYKTWWFYTLIFLALLAVIFFMDRYRIVRLLEEKNRMEDRLVIREQELLDAGQEISTLQSSLAQQDHVVSSLDDHFAQKGLHPSEMLSNFREQAFLIGEVNSHGTFVIKNEYVTSIFLFDVGVTGPASHAIKRYIRSAVEDRIIEVSSADKLREIWLDALAGLRDHLPKFKGVNWLMLALSGGKINAAGDGMHLFQISKGSGDTFKSFSEGKHWELIESNGGAMVCSQRHFEQLDESGTKSYPISNLTNILSKYEQEDIDRLSQRIGQDYEQWRGTMEQFSDVVLFSWNHA